MMLTTKSRYAVMAIVEVAASSQTAPVRLSDISMNQDIPLSYLEQIFVKLKRAGIVTSVKGPGGGYMLTAPLDELNIIDIIDAVEENTKMTRCSKGKGCARDGAKCKTHDLLYLFMFVMPISGLGMSLLGGHDVSIFGLFTISAVEEKKAIAGVFHAVHEVSGFLLAGLVVLHILGSLYHLLTGRADIVRRMFR